MITVKKDEVIETIPIFSLNTKDRSIFKDYSISILQCFLLDGLEENISYSLKVNNKNNDIISLVVKDEKRNLEITYFGNFFKLTTAILVANASSPILSDFTQDVFAMVNDYLSKQKECK